MDLFRTFRKAKKNREESEDKLIQELLEELKSLRKEKRDNHKRMNKLRKEINELKRRVKEPKSSVEDSSTIERRGQRRDLLSTVFKLRLMGVDPKHTFDNFLVDRNNAFAYKVAEQIVQKPAIVYNPVFIYGDVGTGKTHLLHAIANGIKNNHPTMKILYAPVERFINEMIKAVDLNRLENFRNRFREVDVLLIDDIQFLSGKLETQIEFFHTFNELYNRGAQIILSSDRPPFALERLEARLKSRFQAGLILDIKPPGYETRIKILKLRCVELSIQPPQEILEKLSKLFPKNVREMIGALNRVVAYSQFMEMPLNAELVDEVLKGVMISPKGVYDISIPHPLTEEDLREGSENSKLALEISADKIEKTLLEELEKINKKGRTTKEY